MQIEKIVRVMGKQHQRAAQALQLGGGCPLAQIGTDGVPHGFDIGQRVVAQQGQYLIGNGVGKVGIVPVEIFRGPQLKTPHGFVVQSLCQSQRVGHGHQHHFATQQARIFGRLQQGTQMVCGQHAGQFFGVQTGLNVDLGATARRTKVKTGNTFVAAQAGG